MTKDDNLSAINKMDYEIQTRIKALVEMYCLLNDAKINIREE